MGIPLQPTCDGMCWDVMGGLEVDVCMCLYMSISRICCTFLKTLKKNRYKIHETIEHGHLYLTYALHGDFL